mmetsp:Transcript_47961/g.128342  ORF Transcript_47961/g.128342 Transcript_47961/m.128342 type:complete len:242 (-) Transcript_47961:1555-2280(-)
MHALTESGNTMHACNSSVRVTPAHTVHSWTRGTEPCSLQSGILHAVNHLLAEALHCARRQGAHQPLRGGGVGEHLAVHVSVEELAEQLHLLRQHRIPSVPCDVVPKRTLHLGDALEGWLEAPLLKHGRLHPQRHLPQVDHKLMPIAKHVVGELCHLELEAAVAVGVAQLLYELRGAVLRQAQHLRLQAGLLAGVAVALRVLQRDPTGRLLNARPDPRLRAALKRHLQDPHLRARAQVLDLA